MVGSYISNNANRKSIRIRLLILISLWFVCFFPIYPSLVQTWLYHSDNSHGILVPFVSLCFMWQKKEQLRSAKISNTNWGAIILVISLALHLVSYTGGIGVISRSMIVFSLVGLILFSMGKEFFRVLAFPLFFLLFMVPVPESILEIVSFPLQFFATKISSSIIQAFSIPAYREGNMLYFSQTHLEIAKACSGIRSIISFTMLSVIFAYMLNKRWGGKVVLLASAIPLALFANIFRVSCTGVLAHFYGAKVAHGFLHEFSGLAVFAFGFVLLLGEYILLNKAKVTSDRQPVTSNK